MFRGLLSLVFKFTLAKLRKKFTPSNPIKTVSSLHILEFHCFEAKTLKKKEIKDQQITTPFEEKKSRDEIP